MVLFATALMEAPGAGGVVDAALEVSHVSHRPAWLTPLRVSPLGSVGGARCDHAGEVSVHDTIRYDTIHTGQACSCRALRWKGALRGAQSENTQLGRPLSGSSPAVA